MKRIRIVTTKVVFEFTGRYRREMETDNWHYWEKEDGKILHVRKEHIVSVEEL